MANNVQVSNLGVNTALDAMNVLLNSGYLRIYDGTQAANADTAIGAQVLLAELRFNATAFGASVAGVATAGAIVSDASINATGTATWARLLKSDGTSVVVDLSVGTASADIILNSVALQVGALLSISAMTLTLPKA